MSNLLRYLPESAPSLKVKKWFSINLIAYHINNGTTARCKFANKIKVPPASKGK